MKTIVIRYALFDDGNCRCDNLTALNNVVNGIVHPIRIGYYVYYNGPHGTPWRERVYENIPLHILKEEMNSLPQTCTGEAWTGKFLSIRITL